MGEGGGGMPRVALNHKQRLANAITEKSGNARKKLKNEKPGARSTMKISLKGLAAISKPSGNI